MLLEFDRTGTPEQMVRSLMESIQRAMPNMAVEIDETGDAIATGGSSGGGGSIVNTDYDALINKPKINGVTLSGDKSLEALGITTGGGITTETDPTVPSWAKASSKPTYTASEVGALPDTTVIPTVPTNVSAFTNDSGYLTEHQTLKTINNESIVGSGNITIASGGGGATRTQLWSQAAASTNAGAKTLSQSITNFDIIQVVFVDSVSDLTYRIVEVPAAVGVIGVANGIWNLSNTSNIYFVRRSFTLADSSITFTIGQYKAGNAMTTAKTNAGYLIPIAVYGIKY